MKHTVEDIEYEVNFHTCGLEHTCKNTCEVSGECEITYESMEKTKETKLSGTMTYDYIVPKNLKKCCTLTLQPYKNDHTLEHQCGNKKHRCN